ncbi:protein SHQ1 homolog isoform X2 [Eupeodes corollae]|uniref:protein SHQ1 homolog isoform X2 n=1 Tax=Eupeodes corollae TaxID=290404 RepID=UPI002491A62B|nr:protein SHQ1 homolog isoform X2 [Eupeodes corollae]
MGKFVKLKLIFPMGFLHSTEDDMSQICRVTDPSRLSHVQRTIQRENDETKDFCPDQYKLNFFKLQIPEGHEDPMRFEIPYDDIDLTEDDKCILEHIRAKHTDFSLEKDQMFNIDCDLVSVLLGICYDIRFTSNDPTCVSSWTRTILSATLSYFERFEDLIYVVESFIRRSLIYPLCRKYELSRLCVEDVVKALQKGKPWLLKQLLITYNCFCEAEFNRKALNKYFIRHLIWYVDKVMDDEHFQMLSENLDVSLSAVTKTCLRLEIGKIEFELLRELISEIQLEMATDLAMESNEESSESDSEESISHNEGGFISIDSESD